MSEDSVKQLKKIISHCLHVSCLRIFLHTFCCVFCMRGVWPISDTYLYGQLLKVLLLKFTMVAPKIELVLKHVVLNQTTN